MKTRVQPQVRDAFCSLVLRLLFVIASATTLSMSSESGGKHLSNHHVRAYLLPVRRVRVECQKVS